MEKLAPWAYKTGNRPISETVEDRAKVTIVHRLSIAAKMYDLE